MRVNIVCKQKCFKLHPASNRSLNSALRTWFQGNRGNGPGFELGFLQRGRNAVAGKVGHTLHGTVGAIDGQLVDRENQRKHANVAAVGQVATVNIGCPNKRHVPDHSNG